MKSKFLSPAFALLVLFTVRPAGAAAPATPASAILISEFLNEHAPYPACHASTIVETAQHELVAAWFGGLYERHEGVAIWIARFEAGRWLPGVEVANGVQPAGPRQPTWNPVLFQPRNGPLMLFYKVGPSPSRWWGMVMTSADAGRTWSTPRRLPDGILGPIKNKPVQLADGAILSGTSSESADGSNQWRVYFERSNDLGQTWTRTPFLNDGGNIAAIQPSILLLGGDKLQALGRTRQGKLFTIASSDAGRTWGPMTLTSLPNPNSGTDAVTLADGRHLLVYNHSAPPPENPSKGLRYPLDVALSSDGATWRHVLTLESEPAGNGYSYPAVIQTSDGRVHITYTWKREHIKHVVLDPAKL
ncbi:MAG: sialidase [Opitutus sp.]|nr:sialidase [Opitutus sp.]